MKEKQIEEMARDLCHLTCTCEECGNVAEVNKHRCKAKVYARRAYEAGYRKIETSDWLTKGISEEQLEREKQEALDEFAERLGYRKQSEGEWISVEERLPEAGKLVLCIWERGDDKQNYGFGRYQAHDVWYVSNEGMPCVTNWMPLPELPKMEGGTE